MILGERLRFERQESAGSQRMPFFARFRAVVEYLPRKALLIRRALGNVSSADRIAVKVAAELMCIGSRRRRGRARGGAEKGSHDLHHDANDGSQHRNQNYRKQEIENKSEHRIIQLKRVRQLHATSPF